ncbi:hypothetical protein CA13_16880 [Planctomycetes bacterium CA13]|uniref:AZL_007920/MXAN_0976 family protein n=1 Tax=Novipirellula herctigrandis TaxID=2527986 RepID=A0A5C5YYY7_9BACT|nr:hypothetical protein CA13_16880 [Planctomycetes bacterium CA13]
MKMKTLSRLCFLVAGTFAIASTGCTVVGVGTIPSAVEGSNQDLEFAVDVVFVQNGEESNIQEVSGTATFVDCAAGINVTASFSNEEFSACEVELSNNDAVQFFLNNSLAECFGIDPRNFDAETEQVAGVLGRYQLHACHPGKALGHTKGKGHTSHGKGKGKGHDKGHGGGAGEGEVIGTGCLVAIYVDCEADGCIGDGMAVALVDDSDPDNIFYSNCGFLNSGDIAIENADSPGVVIVGSSALD